MPISDLFKLHDPALADQYAAKPYDASKDRKAFIKSLDGVVEQYNNGRTKVPNRMWSAANGVVKLELKFKGRPIAVTGEDTFHIPEDRFAEAINIIKKAVEAGELDEALEGCGGHGANTAAPVKAKTTREFSPESKLNIRVGGFRRGGKSDAEIKKVLTAEGLDAEAISKAIARKPAKK